MARCKVDEMSVCKEVGPQSVLQDPQYLAGIDLCILHSLWTTEDLGGK